MQKIVPAILTDKVEEVIAMVNKVESFSQWVHIDIMNDTFVPYKTVEITDIKGASSIHKIEAHLMVNEPGSFFCACEEVGCSRVVVHYEAVTDMAHLLEKAKDYTFDFVIALNPDTEVRVLEAYINDIDGVLLMSVFPGKSGQHEIKEVFKKAKEVRDLRNNIYIGIDGGIDKDNISEVCLSGVDYACVNSGLFNSDNIEERYNTLTQLMTC